MSSCCDRTISALIGSVDAAAGSDPASILDPLREVAYRQRVARLRQQLWQFRHDQQVTPSSAICFIRRHWRRRK
ncbi:MAG TPA: hypothetical protein VM639_11165 [Dongiaceae bacterium]|nr:hypothetical protein [Dongiaceae bacterium]